MIETESVEAALLAAFPPVPIARATIDEPTAVWEVYDDYPDVVELEHRAWSDLSAEFLYRHPSLLVYAGDVLFHAVLPAYLRYLLHEHTTFNALPFQVAGQLTRSRDAESSKKFDRRLTVFTSEQRVSVRDVLALLANAPPMEEPMTRALATWEHV